MVTISGGVLHEMQADGPRGFAVLKVAGDGFAHIVLQVGQVAPLGSDGCTAMSSRLAETPMLSPPLPLTGDKGTVVQLEMEILAGWILHGVGHGTDNKGQQYQVQF